MLENLHTLKSQSAANSKKLLDAYLELAEQSLHQLSKLNHSKDDQLFLKFKDALEKLPEAGFALRTSVSSRPDNFGSASKRSSESFEKSVEHPRKLSLKKPDLIIDEFNPGYLPKLQKSTSSDDGLQPLSERKKSNDSSGNKDFKKKKKKKYVRTFQDSQ